MRTFASSLLSLRPPLRLTRGLVVVVVWADLLLDEKGKAVRLLLDTPASHPKFYPDMLKACLIAASHSQQSFQQTVCHLLLLLLLLLLFVNAFELF